jgi:hypothetical protein
MDSKKTQALWRRNKTRCDREKILDILGRECVLCGFDDERALHIDHVHGNGRAQRKEHGGSTYSAILKDLIGGSKDYQVLCANCNAIKRCERKEFTPRKHEGEWKRKPLEPCGTHACYHRGCRCEKCYQAHREYCKIAMKKTRGADLLAA